jgi:hypothetical protein
MNEHQEQRIQSQKSRSFWAAPDETTCDSQFERPWSTLGLYQRIGFSRAAAHWSKYGFSRCETPKPQGLKPDSYFRLTARLKPCPDTKPAARVCTSLPDTSGTPGLTASHKAEASSAAFWLLAFDYLLPRI